ncbi:uncharacterized protein LOC128181239 [Crassostrea angulata]|uniref:uncharacterized protein LOC128181239 n=1 Tax=Magallana angulata TaxID=2784310 RepID=UPI0022B14311|nr:uncharacterized protein LOC128181239 [Crassostrea angulata]
MCRVLPFVFYFCFFGPSTFCQYRPALQSEDLICRYRVHYPKTTWHTAHNVCSGDNMTLARLSNQTEVQLIDDLYWHVLKIINELDIKGDLQDVWIDGFMWSSFNKTMTQNCQSLDTELPITLKKNAYSDFLCVYYNFTDKQLYTDDCDENRPFLCESLTDDLNDCFALTEIGSLKNTQMIGICQLRSHSTIENCKTSCLRDSRCFGVEHNVYVSTCMEYIYRTPTSRCYFSRGATHFSHKAIFIYHAVPYMPVAPKPFYEWCQDIFGPYVWKTVPRLLDGGIAEDPSQSFTEHTASLCAMKCQLRQLCQLFQCNTLTAECDLYDGIGFRRISNVTGNQFFQKMPTSCETGRDEWFPEYQNCIWIPMYAYPYEEAKNKCEAVGKVMMGTENYQKVMHLMNVTNAKSTHVYSRHLGNNTYQWIDGTMIPASQWCPGQPAENTGCLGVQNDLDSACPQGGLYEIPCSFSNRFFCVEKNKNTVRRWVDKA